MTDRARNIKAIGFVTFGFFLFSINDALIKLLAQSYTVPQTLFWTAFFVCPVLLGYGLLSGGREVFRSPVWRWHFVRGLAMTAVVFCNIYALTRIQVTDFYAIVFITPMVISLSSWLFLKDRLTAPQVFTIIGGFLVVLYMCRPGSGLFNIGALSALGGAMFLSLASVLLRSHLRAENPLLIGISTPLVIATVALPISLYSGFTLPLDGQSFVLFFICGLAAGFGGLFFGKGFQYASSAAAVAPFHYTQMIWGAALGFMIFGEIPKANVIIGACALAALGIYLIISEARSGKKENKIVDQDLVMHDPV